MVAAAVILQQDNAVARPVASLSRAEVLTRYRHFREISKFCLAAFVTGIVLAAASLIS